MLWMQLWHLLDPLYFSCTRLQYVNRPNGNIFRVRLLSYKGPQLILSDGTLIRKGELLLKIHLHNVRILQMLRSSRSPFERARKLHSLAEQSLPGIAEYVAEHRHREDIRAIIGFTQLNRAVAKLGFETHEFPHHWQVWLRRLALLPIYLLTVQSPWRTFAKHRPKMLLMSRSQLLERYLTLPSLASLPTFAR